MFSSSIKDIRTAGEVNTAMGRVYGYMGLAVVNSMIVSFLISTSPDLMQVLHTGFMHWVVLLAPLAAVFAIGMVAERLTKGQLQLCLHGFAALMGLSISTIFVVYTSTSIVSAFMGAAVLFGVMSFYGYFTKKSLDSWGKYLFIALIAIIIASLINLFIGSSVLQMVVSAIAIVVFLGLTAYDTQTIRDLLMNGEDGRVEVMGALNLYLDFINLFMSLLQLFGDRK